MYNKFQCSGITVANSMQIIRFFFGIWINETTTYNTIIRLAIRGGMGRNVEDGSAESKSIVSYKIANCRRHAPRFARYSLLGSCYFLIVRAWLPIFAFPLPKLSSLPVSMSISRCKSKNLFSNKKNRLHNT